MNGLKILLLMISLCAISGCAAPLVLFGGAVGTGATLSKEQTVGSTVDDHSIWAKIKAGFLEHNKEVEGILTNISVEVSEGRVLLTGFVSTPQERLIILKIVWEQAGVREVINEIKLSDETNQSNAKQYGNDAWITAQVKSKMLLNNDVRSINYSVETVDSVVYILGIARSETELNSIKEIAENVKGVNRFVSYIRVNGKQKAKEPALEKKQQTEPLFANKPKAEVSVAKEKEPEEPSTHKKEEIGDDEIEIEYLDSDD